MSPLPRSATLPLSGRGRCHVEECVVYRPEREAELAEIVARAPTQSVVSRGMGRSYGDASLNAGSGVVLHERFDRFLDFDEETAIVSCEANVTFSEIVDVLLPRGFFMPITPGTKHISVGGAIAADVRGKNHHRDGTVSRQLVDFRLLTGDGRILTCSRDENPDIFWATLGGTGLTGAILQARLRVRRGETAWVRQQVLRCADLDQALESMLGEDADFEYAVGWSDCLACGRLGPHARQSGFSRRPACRTPRRPAPHLAPAASHGAVRAAGPGDQFAQHADLQPGLLARPSAARRPPFAERAGKGFGDGVEGFIACHGEMPEEDEARRDPAVLRRMVEVNYTSMVSLLERAAEQLLPRGRGFLCAVTSVAGDRGRPRNHVHGSTRSAVGAYLQGLRARLAKSGVSVVDVRPGVVDTAMTWGLPGLPRQASPERVARDVLRRIARDAAVVYTPWVWRIVMAIIRAIPDRVFKRIDL